MSTRLERLLFIDRKIRSPLSFDAQRLANELDVSLRTIQGDLAFLRDRFQAPLIYDRQAGRYRYTDSSFTLPAIDLNDGELLALLLGERILRHLAGDALGVAYSSALSKIEGRLPEAGISVPIEGLWFGGDMGPPLPSGLFRHLLDAVQDRHTVELTYRAASTDQITRRTVEPYGLYLHRQTWYLIARCRLRQDFRYFHLARVQAWDVLDERFELLPDFDMTAYLRRAFRLEQGPDSYEVIVRFAEPSARYVRERRWHAEQELIELPGGRIELRFPAASLREVKQWVLGYGADAEVVAPGELREMVARELARMQAAYHRTTRD